MTTMLKSTRKEAGTTLVEILVVIVVFAVGLLAVAQIFPRGFGILNLNRAASMATYQAQDQMEKLYAHPDTLPDAIVPIAADTGAADPNFVSTSLGFEGVGIGSGGTATLPDGATTDATGNPLNWEEISAFNNVRGIIGENQSIPAPTLVGAPGNAAQYYGGLVTLQFGPTSMPTAGTLSNPGPVGPLTSNLLVYGNDFTRNLGPVAPGATVNDFSFFYDPYSNPGQFNILVPSAAFSRIYLITFSGYVTQGTGNPIKKNYQVISPAVSATPPGQQATFTTFTLNSSLFVGNDVLTSIDYQSIRVQPLFNQVAAGTNWTGNPFEVRVLNAQLGTFLFNPAAYSFSITRPEGAREALRARFNYAVKDWRILREDFRIDGTTPSTHQLPIQSLRTNGLANVDGTPASTTGNGFGFSALPNDATQGIDHFVLIDLQTGGVFYCFYNGQPLVTLDKSRGIITFNSLAGNATLQGELYLPDGTSETVNLANRPVRALYQARYDWAVQVLKAAANYTPSELTPSIAQYYVGGTSQSLGGSPTRLYFPRCDTGRKVVIGQVWYEEPGDTQPRSITSQDFVIHPAGGSGDTTGLPYVDITDVDSKAQTLDQNTYGYAARDVKGSSLMVRVVWNPNTFTLTNNGNGSQTAAELNVQAENRWAQSYRVSASETFLDQGVLSR